MKTCSPHGRRGWDASETASVTLACRLLFSAPSTARGRDSFRVPHRALQIALARRLADSVLHVEPRSLVCTWSTNYTRIFSKLKQPLKWSKIISFIEKVPILIKSAYIIGSVRRL